MAPSEYAKAITGAGLAGLGALGTALADGAVTAGEWVVVAIAVLAAFGAVFGVPNTSQQPKNAAGHVDITSVLAAAFIATVVVVLLLLVFPALSR